MRTRRFVCHIERSRCYNLDITSWIPNRLQTTSHGPRFFSFGPVRVPFTESHFDEEFVHGVTGFCVRAIRGRNRSLFAPGRSRSFVRSLCTIPTPLIDPHLFPESAICLAAAASAARRRLRRVVSAPNERRRASRRAWRRPRDAADAVSSPIVTRFRTCAIAAPIFALARPPSRRSWKQTAINHPGERFRNAENDCAFCVHNK